MMEIANEIDPPFYNDLFGKLPSYREATQVSRFKFLPEDNASDKTSSEHETGEAFMTKNFVDNARVCSTALFQ